MKRIVSIALLAVGLLAPLAQAQTPPSIGAGSVGYGLRGEDRGEFFVDFWAGLRAREVSPTAATYVCFQHLGQNGGTQGNGVMAVLASETFIPRLFLLVDVGAAWGLARNADSTTTAGLTTGGGLAYKISPNIAPYVYFHAYDRGPKFTGQIYAGLAVLDLGQVAGLGGAR